MNYKATAKRIVSTMAGRYLPDGPYRVMGRRFLVNRKDAAFGDFARDARAPFSPPAYAKAAARIYREQRDAITAGVHPALGGFRPNVSSWIPYISGQSSAFVLNFPAVQYSVNDPLVMVARFVLYKGSRKVVDECFTRALLANTACRLSWPEALKGKLEDGLEGRLIVYTYSPLFRGKEFRFFATFHDGGLMRAGCHSWPSAEFALFPGRRRFQFRDQAPGPVNGERYKYFQELYSALPCELSPARGAHDAPRLRLTDYSDLYTAGYFAAFDGKTVRSLWHDNGGVEMTHYPFPATEGVDGSTVETDFYAPARGFYARVVMDHPIGIGIAVGEALKVSAFRQGEARAFHEEEVPVDYGVFGAKPGFVQLDLKAFFQRMSAKAGGEAIVQVTLSFKPKGSAFTTKGFQSIQAHVYFYDEKNAPCDQYHTGVSSSQLYNSGSYASPRSNKFGPFLSDANNASYVLINNRFPRYMAAGVPEAGVSHKIRLTLFLNGEQETRVKYLTTSPSSAFYAVEVADFFGLPKDRPHEGVVHVFSPTANFWGYFMTVGRKDGDFAVMCDHLSGG